jgi:hypothetical protein
MGLLVLLSSNRFLRSNSSAVERATHWLDEFCAAQDAGKLADMEEC